MKKYLLIAILLISFVLSAGEKVKNKTEVKPLEIPATQNSREYKVTFIELGSVNCIPCKMMVPIMDAVEKKYPEVKVVFHDVWTAEGEPYAGQYGIRGIPTQIFLDKNGKEYFRHSGFFPQEELCQVIEEGLKK